MHPRYPYKLEELVAAVVSSPAGLHVGWDDLHIYRLEDGRYAVNFTNTATTCEMVEGKRVITKIKRRHKDFERLFTDPLDAAKFFDGKRLSMEMGFDCEVKPGERAKFIREREMMQHKPRKG